MKIVDSMRQVVAASQHRSRRDVRWQGQSLVEMALMLPLIALILLGTVDLARAFIYYERLTNAVKEGAFYGISFPANITSTSVTDVNGDYVSADPNNIVYRVKQEGANSAGTPDGNLVITITTNSNSDVLCYAGRSTTLKNVSTSSYPGDCSKAEAGDTIQVRARYNFRPLTKQMVGILGGSPFTMTKSVRMVILQ